MVSGVVSPSNAAPPQNPAIRGIASIRQNAYSASAARIGGSTIISRIAVCAGNAVNSAIGIRYSQPDCGSAANGRPDSTCGSHSGTCPLDRLWPRNVQVGSHSSRTSLPTSTRRW